MPEPSIPPQPRPEPEDLHVLQGLSSTESRASLSASLSAGEVLVRRVQSELGSDGFLPSVLQAVYLREQFRDLVKGIFETLVVEASTAESPILGLIHKLDLPEAPMVPAAVSEQLVSWIVDIDPVVVSFVERVREFQEKGHPLNLAEKAAFTQVAYELPEMGAPILKRLGGDEWLSLYRAMESLEGYPVMDAQIRSNILSLISQGRVSPDCPTERCEDAISELQRVMRSDQEQLLRRLAEGFSTRHASSLDEISFPPSREMYKSTHHEDSLRDQPAFRWQFAISASYEGLAALKSVDGDVRSKSIGEQLERVLARVDRLIADSEKRLKSCEEVRAPKVVLDNTRDYTEYYRYMRVVLDEHRPKLEQFFAS